MSSLLDSILGSMTEDDSLSALSGKTGASKDQLSSLLGSALPQLMGSMTNNASTQDGALSLAGALAQHTDTAPVAQQIADADEEDGGKIIGHILGLNQSNVINQLSGETGMNDQAVTSALSNIAPALLSGISAATGGGKTGPKFDLSDGFDYKDIAALTGKLLGKKKTSSSTNGLDLLNLLGKFVK